MLPGDYDVRTKGLGGIETAKAVLPYLLGKKTPATDIAFLAANAIDPDLGFSADSPLFTSFRAQVIRHAKRLFWFYKGRNSLKVWIIP